MHGRSCYKGHYEQAEHRTARKDNRLSGGGQQPSGYGPHDRYCQKHRGQVPGKYRPGLRRIPGQSLAEPQVQAASM